MVFVLDMLTCVVGIFVICIFTLIAYASEKGFLYIISMALSVYMLSDVFRSPNIVVAIAYDPNLAAFQTYTIDPNVMAVLFSLLLVVNFILLVLSRKFY